MDRTGSRSPNDRSAPVLALVAALVALTALVWWMVGTPAATSGTARPEVAAGRSEVRRTQVELPAFEPDERASIADTAVPDGVDDSTPSAAVALRSWLQGRVVDIEGAPVTGAVVEMRRGVLASRTVLDLDLRQDRRTDASTVTDGLGEFRFALDRGIPVEVAAAHDPEGTATVPDCYAGSFVTVALTPGFRVHGRIVREIDGSPVEDAVVRVFRSGGRPPFERITHSRQDGTFEVRLPSGDAMTLSVRPVEEQSSKWIFLEFDENREAEVEVVVETGVVVTGRVLSAADGRPIAGATVGEGWTYRRRAVTDRGTYRLTGFGAPGIGELFALSHGSRADDALGPASGRGRRDAASTSSFLSPRRAHGRVIGSDGRPLVDVLAVAIASMRGPQGHRTDWLSTRSDADGRFEIDEPRPISNTPCCSRSRASARASTTSPSTSTPRRTSISARSSSGVPVSS
ncbi:MAG: hypothetical protein R3F34_13375 [Planctomycetota bacterium]